MSITCLKRACFLYIQSGILLIIFGTGVTFAQTMLLDPKVAAEKCSKYTAQQQTSCKACVVAPGIMEKQPMCKDYLHLMRADTSVESHQKIEKIDPGDIEKNITELKSHCKSLNPSKKIVNCRCWEKEFRENLAKGINNNDLSTGISNACVATKRIKKYQYASCVTQEKQWLKIVDFESYCGCVSDYIATETKKRWGVGATPQTLRRPAIKACGYAQQEKLTPEAAKERLKKYGRRGPLKTQQQGK